MGGGICLDACLGGWVNGFVVGAPGFPLHIIYRGIGWGWGAAGRSLPQFHPIPLDTVKLASICLSELRLLTASTQTGATGGGPGRPAAPGLRALVATMGGAVPLRLACAGGGTRFLEKLGYYR